LEEGCTYFQDLDNIKASKPYQRRMQKRIKRAKLPEGMVLDWKNDSGEYATRIWKWWKGMVMVGEINSKFMALFSI